MSDIYQVPFRNQVARSVLRPTFRFLFHLLARISIKGRENVPPQGAYLIATNHVSLFDPPLLIAFWPVSPEAVGAIEIWSKPGQATLARLYGGIPVHRGQYDRGVIRTALHALNSGRPLVIAPEGGRSHKPGLQKGLPGIAFLMERARVPVIPVGIVGTTDDFFSRAIRGERPLLEIHIGQLINLPGITGTGDERRQALQKNLEMIMAYIATLLPHEYRGVYASAAQPLEK